MPYLSLCVYMCVRERESVCVWWKRVCESECVRKRVCVCELRGHLHDIFLVVLFQFLSANSQFKSCRDSHHLVFFNLKFLLDSFSVFKSTKKVGFCLFVFLPFWKKYFVKLFSNKWNTFSVTPNWSNQLHSAFSVVVRTKYFLRWRNPFKKIFGNFSEIQKKVVVRIFGNLFVSPIFVTLPI
jgi:hypothetical protein